MYLYNKKLTNSVWKYWSPDVEVQVIMCKNDLYLYNNNFV